MEEEEGRGAEVLALYEAKKRRLFCARCGSVIRVATQECVECGRPHEASGSLGAPVETRLPPSELLRELRLQFLDTGEDDQKEAVIEEQCPKCKHNRLSYRTAQLRSADEGQTIFYTCLRCKHRFTVNS